MTTLTRAEVEDIAEAAAKAAVRETLLLIGVDLSDPLATQRDFAVMREVGRHAMDSDFRKDLEFAREWRLGMQSLRSTGVRTAIGLLVTAIASAIWLGIHQLLARGR
jgi:hypothetical protein